MIQGFWRSQPLSVQSPGLYGAKPSVSRRGNKTHPPRTSSHMATFPFKRSPPSQGCPSELRPVPCRQQTQQASPPLKPCSPSATINVDTSCSAPNTVAGSTLGVTLHIVATAGVDGSWPHWAPHATRVEFTLDLLPQLQAPGDCVPTHMPQGRHPLLMGILLHWILGWHHPTADSLGLWGHQGTGGTGRKTK